ncbi:hypothetical protein ACES2L_01765 [Bdellovibrio bacteriovorus]
MFSFVKFIEKKSASKIFILITAQQGLMAFSTYALAQAGINFDNRTEFIFWVLTSLFVFLLNPVFSIFIRKLESIVGLHAYGIFLNQTLFSKSGVASFWQNKNEKDRFLASIGSDANDYLALILFISMDIYSFTLSIALNVLVLGFAIDMSLIPAFLISGILSFITYRFFSKKVEQLYSLEQTARTDLSGLILKSWDNVLLNNRTIIESYHNKFNEKLGAASKAAATSAVGAELLVFILGLTAGLPIVISVAYILWGIGAEDQKNTLIALLATLPRQLNILGVYRNIFQSLTSLLGINTKFSVIQNGTALSSRDLIRAINLSTIIAGQKSLKDISEFETALAKNPKGRIEVRGANGSGKSTLLLHLNKSLPSSFYLPSAPDLMLGNQMVGKSSGEMLLEHIEYLKSIPAEVILLDEWDANLDNKNLQILEHEIQKLSQVKTIVEIRHRESVYSE